MHGEVRYAKCMLVLSEYNFPLDMKCQTVKPRGFFIKLFYSFTLTHTHLYMHAHICHIIYTKMHDIHSEYRGWHMYVHAINCNKSKVQCSQENRTTRFYSKYRHNKCDTSVLNVVVVWRLLL